MLTNGQTVAVTVPPPPQFAESDLPTVNAVVEEKRKQAEKVAQKTAAPPPPTEEAQTTAAPEPGHAQSPEELEEEAGQQGAFDPETGEINWDCPCLGGMADGPCGEEFKAAFSCFVYSTEEPKGMDCIDKFQYVYHLENALPGVTLIPLLTQFRHMQDCFRKYPEVYGAELAEDEDGDAPAPVDGAASGDGDDTANKDQERTPEEASQKEAQHSPVTATPETTSEAAQPSPDAKTEERATKLKPADQAVAEQVEEK